MCTDHRVCGHVRHVCCLESVSTRFLATIPRYKRTQYALLTSVNILSAYVTSTPKRKRNHTYRVRMPTNVFVASFAEIVACSVSTRFLSATSRYKLAQTVRHTRTRTLSTSAFVATFATFVTHSVSVPVSTPFSNHNPHKPYT